MEEYLAERFQEEEDRVYVRGLIHGAMMGQVFAAALILLAHLFGWI